MDRFSFDACPGVLVVATLDGVVLESNLEARHALGAPSTPGKRLLQGVHPEDQGAFGVRWSEIAGGGEPARGVSRFQGSDGHYHSYAWTAARTPGRDEVMASMVLVSSDASTLDAKERDAPASLGDKATLLDLLLDHCPVSLTVIDREGMILIYEGKGVEISGNRRGQLVGQSLFEIYGTALPEQIAKIRRTVTAGESAEWIIEFRGSLWQCWSLPFRDQRGEIIGAALFTADRSDEKRTMLELQNKIDVIDRQQEVIRNLETPIIQVWDRVLTLPMVGMVDSQRAARVMNDLLTMIVARSAEFAILDLTGVDTVDAATASYLLQMISAIRLLGAEGVISGIRPTVAQTMITLGVDLSQITACSHLQDALKLCIRRMREGASTGC